MPNRNTDKLAQIQAEETTLPPDEQGATRLIDLHLYPLPEPEAPTDDKERSEDVSQDQQPTAAPHEENYAPEVIVSVPPPQRKHPPRMLVLAGICSLLLISVAITALVIWPLVEPVATITIIPISRQIMTTARIQIASGATSNGQTIAGRLLATVSISEQKSIPTTGKAHQDARAAHGLVTFYNAATYPQTIPAGTLLISTDGVQIVTDQDAPIPAGTLATNGQVTITAHAVQTGPVGNLKAGAIYDSCCRINVFAANATFTGGQAARDYPTATSQDISEAATSVKMQLDQSVQAALQAEVQSDETLITLVPCQQRVTADHHPGEEATQEHVTVSETCTGAVYQTQAYQDAITQIEMQQATAQLGDGYLLVGTVQSSIMQATTNDHQQIALVVKIAGSWVYQFHQQDQQHMIALIAGKGKAQALTLLEHVPGVRAVSLTIKNDAAILPTDATSIHLVVLITG